MKTALLQTTLLITLAAFINGCSGGNKLANQSTISTAGTVGTTTGTSTDAASSTGLATWPFAVSGEVVSFVPVSWEEMNSYVGLRPLNNPSDAKLNINLKQVSGVNLFAGTVRLGYTDTNQFYYGQFTVGDGKNVDCQNCYNNGDYEAGYNYWTVINGKRTFMAYFQDAYGAIILVMEDGLGANDGQGSTVLQGRLYYKNFAQSLNPQSPYRKCWYIYAGPYACASTVMAAKSSSTDFDGYRLLGSFAGVRANVAFGQ